MWKLAKIWYRSKAELNYKRPSRNKVISSFAELGPTGDILEVPENSLRCEIFRS
jgi:hypothetical protein